MGQFPFHCKSPHPPVNPQDRPGKAVKPNQEDPTGGPLSQPPPAALGKGTRVTEHSRTGKAGTELPAWLASIPLPRAGPGWGFL